MAREKAPAFQFYTKDWDSDINVIPMTYEEEGVYFALIRLLWNHPKLSANLDELRLLLKGKPRLSLMQKWWKSIGKCFFERDGMLCHKRVERERRKQAKFRKSQSDKGKKGGRPKSRGLAVDNPELHSGKALLSASSSTDLKNPQPPKGGSRKRPRTHLRAVGLQAQPEAVAEAIETRQRRADLIGSGLTDDEAEAVLHREYLDRKAATA